MDKTCGLDVHKDSVFACVLDETGKKILEERYGTLTPDLDRLRDQLISSGCGCVAMESTSIYWIPVWNVLRHDFKLTLANPLFIKQMPGRKSDVKDAEWIADCLGKNLIKGSYVPDGIVQEMRQYGRRYRNLSKKIVRVTQQMDNYLQRCNIRFSNYISNQNRNASQRKILKAIIGGECDPVKLSRLVHGRTRNKHGEQTIIHSLTGVILASDVEMFRQVIEELELLETQQAACLTHLEELASHYFAREISLLCTIPGIQSLSAKLILSELGGDLSSFRNASALVGWAGLRPRNDESAGKVKSREILHGNKYLRQVLIEAAWAASRSEKNFMGRKHQQLAKRMKSQKALLAITRKLLVIVFNVLSKKQPFDNSRNMASIAPVS